MRIAHLGLTLAIAALTGCSSPTASGKLVDVIAGDKPIANMRLIAEATGSASLSCSAFEAETDANGEFKFEGLCSGTPYALKTGNENLWLADVDTIPDGGGDGLTIKAWRAPKGSGVYLMDAAGEIKMIKTSADIKREPIWNDEEAVAEYPATIPKSPAVVPADGFLVLVGDRAVKQMKYWPLISSPERKFGSAKTTKITMDPWAYIGIDFKSDTEYERKTAELDSSKVITQEKGDRIVAWVPGTALPAGRYAMHKEEDSRTTVVDFGKAPE